MRALRAQQESAEDPAGGAMEACPHCGRMVACSDRFCAGCGGTIEISGPVEDPLIGKVIGEKYEVLELAGMGGMARVYRAEQIMLGRPVALKVVHPHFAANEELRQRFYREARASSALNHPNSVRIIDFGTTDAGVLYLVMEYLEGEDLGELVVRQGVPTQLRACEIVADVLSALEEAHACGVVHRDLKPDNIFVERLRTDRSVIKVLDFGIATLAEPGDGSTSITQAGLLCGTPEYMSPEQVSGATLDGRSDLYSMGVVLYEMLTGNVPFRASSPAATALCHIDQPVPSLEAMAQQEVPASLRAIVERALQKDPADRFESAAEMHAALTAHIASQRSTPAGGIPTASPSTVPLVDAFVGRHQEINELLHLLTAAHRRATCVNVYGEVGVGKTRLVHEFAAAVEGPDCVVATAAPHPSTAPVAYWPVRCWMRALWATDDAGLLERCEGSIDPLEAAGIREVLNAEAQPARDRWPRAPLVARALESAVRFALQSPERRLMLVLDDAATVDGTSLQVLAGLIERTAEQSFLVCCISAEPLGRQLPVATGVLEVKGLARPTVATNPSWESGVRTVGGSERAAMRPLYVQQLALLGASFDISGDPGLAELVDARLQQLDVPQRLLLQHASVVGQQVPLTQLRSQDIDGIDDVDAQLDALFAAGLVRRVEDRLEFSHPFIREAVESSMPAALRASLHHEALLSCDEAAEPIEVRAWHASKAGDAGAACDLLAEAGVLAFRRGDAHLARRLYRRAWELATEAAESAGSPAVHRTLVTVASGLGLALQAIGDALGAEWLLREQIERAPAGDDHRPRLMLTLAQVLRDGGRHDESRALLQETLDAARTVGAVECQAAAHEALAGMDEADGEWNAALSHLLSAHGLTYEGGGDALQQALISLRLGSVMGKVGDLSGAVAALTHADTAARQCGALDIAARALLGLACAEAERSAGQRARELCREGMVCAASAGHAALHERFAEGLAATEGIKRPGPKLQRVLEAG